MPHGGYHGVVKMGGKIVQQGSPAGAPPGQGGIYNPQGYATEMAGSSAPSTTENIEKQIEDQIQKIKKDRQSVVIADPDDARSAFLATQPGIANLSNLLRQQQEQNLANQVKSLFAKAGSDKETADNLRKLFTGDLGDKTFLGINLGSTETTDPDKTSGLGAATVINPFTGERITTGKIREGMTSPEYAQYMSELYNLNPALMEQMFPVASGNLAQPILARLLEGGLMKDAGKLAGNVREGIASFVDTITGGRFTPTGGTVRPSDGGISNIRADNFGETVPGSKFIKTVPRDKDLPYIHSGEIPSELLEGFKKFYQNYEGPIIGGAAITGVTLPDGSVVEFGDTGSARVFKEYLESLGVSQPPATGVDVVERTPQPTGITGFDVDKFYASLPQFQQSYSQQGVSPSLLQFLETAQRFPTV